MTREMLNSRKSCNHSFISIWTKEIQCLLFHHLYPVYNVKFMAREEVLDLGKVLIAAVYDFATPCVRWPCVTQKIMWMEFGGNAFQSNSVSKKLPFFFFLTHPKCARVCEHVGVHESECVGVSTRLPAWAWGRSDSVGKGLESPPDLVPLPLPSYRCWASPGVCWAPGPAAAPSSAHRSPCAWGTGSRSSPAPWTGPWWWGTRGCSAARDSCRSGGWGSLSEGPSRSCCSRGGSGPSSAGRGAATSPSPGCLSSDWKDKPRRSHQGPGCQDCLIPSPSPRWPFIEFAKALTCV